MSETTAKVPAAVVAAAGWVVPGLGYWLVGQRGRAVACFVAITGLFLAGLLVAGVRVIDVPGYGEDGRRVLVALQRDSQGNVMEVRGSEGNGSWVASHAGARWILQARPLAELMNKPWYIGQILAGPMTVVCSKYSIDLSRPLEAGSDVAGAAKAHVRIAEIGTLYTAVAGMLNLLVIIDAAHRANRGGKGAVA